MSEAGSGQSRFYDTHDAGDEWATPPRIWRPLANALGGFDLDVAAGCEPEPIADDNFTKAENGLARPWRGDVWMNHPYGKKTNEKWAKKATAEARRDAVDTITALVPNATGAHWYQDYFGTADLETHIRGRVDFIGGKDHDPSFYSVIVTWGDVPSEYVEALESLGQVRLIPSKTEYQSSLITATDGGETPATSSTETEQ